MKIVFEGMDNCGKTTHIKLLYKALSEILVDNSVLLIKEPGTFFLMDPDMPGSDLINMFTAIPEVANSYMSSMELYLLMKNSQNIEDPQFAFQVRQKIIEMFYQSREATRIAIEKITGRYKDIIILQDRATEVSAVAYQLFGYNVINNALMAKECMYIIQQYKEFTKSGYDLLYYLYGHDIKRYEVQKSDIDYSKPYMEKVEEAYKIMYLNSEYTGYTMFNDNTHKLTRVSNYATIEHNKELILGRSLRFIGDRFGEKIFRDKEKIRSVIDEIKGSFRADSNDSIQ